MKLLIPDSDSHVESPIVTLFGAGLIGSAIAAELLKSADLTVTDIELTWSNPERFLAQLSDVAQAVTTSLNDLMAAGRLPSVRVVWSAGQAGFQATESDIAREFDRFNDVINCIESLVDRFPEASWTVLLFSSAGGLYEGQQHVDGRSLPSPSRPYSFLKLMQEDRLRDCPTSITKKIYRPTSVYGYVRHQQRRGLIPTLIADGIRQRASQITGLPTTLRDYVWIEDLARYLAAVILDRQLCNIDTVEILGSGKPSSIFEIQQIIERNLRRPLYVRYSSPKDNGNSITFSADSLPPDWSSSELETNVRKIVADALNRPAIELGSL